MTSVRVWKSLADATMIREFVALSGVTFTPPSSSAERTSFTVTTGPAPPGRAAAAGAPGVCPGRFSDREARTLATSSASAFSR